MSKLKVQPVHKNSLSYEGNCSSSLYKANPTFNLPVFSFKEEGSGGDTKQIWSLLSKQILTPFAPKFKLYDYQKFLPTTCSNGVRSSVDAGHYSPTRRPTHRSKISNFLSENKGRVENSPTRQNLLKKSAVRFNLKSVSPRKRDVIKVLRQNELFPEPDKAVNQTTDGAKNPRSFRFLSYNNLEFPGIENDNSERPRRLSMAELPIERLLDDVDENVDDKSERDNLSVSNSRPRSMIFDTELSLIRRTRFYTMKKKDTASLVIQEKPSDNTDTFPIRRKSCTCRDCGVSKKLAKTNTIFLEEDLDLLKGKPRKRGFNKEKEVTKPNLMALLGKNLRSNTSFSDSSDRGGRRKVAKKMLQIFQMNRVLRSFTSKKTTHSLTVLPTVASISKLEENTEAQPAGVLFQKIKDSRRTSSGLESTGKGAMLSTERDKCNLKSHRGQEGNASCSGLATTNNESMSNSRLMSPMNRTRVYENKTIAEEKELMQSSHKKIVTNGVSLNELAEDFGDNESKVPSINKQQSSILESVRKENQTPNNKRMEHLDPQILKEKLEAQRMSNRGSLKSREVTSPSSNRLDTVSSKRVLSLKIGMLSPPANFENFFQKKPATDLEFERQVRDVIAKTRKHIDLPNKENIITTNYNPKWFASPKEKLPSLEKRMTETYCKKENFDSVKLESKCRPRNPGKQRKLGAFESVASSTQLNTSSRKLASRATSDQRANVSQNVTEPISWDKREPTVNVNSQHELSQSISKFNFKRGLVALANTRALK